MISKIISALLVSALSCTPIFAAASHDTGKSTSAATSSVKNKQTQKDADILGVLVVLNNNEIAAGNEASKKATDPKVKDFAEMMVKQHTQNLDDTMKLSEKINIKPMDTTKSNSMKKQGKMQLDKLSAMKDKAFDAAYMSDMVKGHADALKLIDNSLLKNVTNPELKAQLEETRKHVEHHLEAAKEVQKDLK
jgi:putative membrane protein